MMNEKLPNSVDATSSLPLPSQQVSNVVPPESRSYTSTFQSFKNLFTIRRRRVNSYVSQEQEQQKNIDPVILPIMHRSSWIGFWKIFFLFFIICVFWLLIDIIILGFYMFGPYNTLRITCLIIGSFVSNLLYLLPMYWSRAWWCECIQCHQVCVKWKKRSEFIRFFIIYLTLVMCTFWVSSIVTLMFKFSYLNCCIIVFASAAFCYILLFILCDIHWLPTSNQITSRTKCIKRTRFNFLFVCLLCLVAFVILFTINRLYCFIPCDQSKQQGMIQFCRNLGFVVPNEFNIDIDGYCYDLRIFNSFMDPKSACTMIRLAWFILIIITSILFVNFVTVK